MARYNSKEMDLTVKDIEIEVDSLEDDVPQCQRVVLTVDHEEIDTVSAKPKVSKERTAEIDGVKATERDTIQAPLDSEAMDPFKEIQYAVDDGKTVSISAMVTTRTPDDPEEDKAYFINPRNLASLEIEAEE